MLIVSHNAISCDKGEKERENMNEWSAVLFHFLHLSSSTCRVASISRSSLLQRIQLAFSCIMNENVKCYFIFIFGQTSNKTLSYVKRNDTKKRTKIKTDVIDWRGFGKKLIHVKRYLIGENVHFRINMTRVLMIELKLLFWA